MSAAKEEAGESVKEKTAEGTEAADTVADPTKAAVDEVKKKIKPKAAIEGC